jgi:hypothetical protein
VRLYNFGSTATFDPPLLDVVDEPNYWFSNVDPLYVKYVSNDTAYGMDLSLWSESFADYHATRLAVKTCKRITGKFPDDVMKAGKGRARRCPVEGRDGRACRLPSAGTWTLSRRGGFSDRNMNNTR